MATLIHAIIGYFVLVLVVRVLTRRPGGQMTMFEFVIVFLIGGVIILATMGQDRSMTNAVCAVMTVGLLHRLFATLKAHYPKFGAVIDGTPIVLIRDGQFQSEIMRKAHIDPEDLLAAARQTGLKSLQQIRYAVLERDGSISVIREKR